VISITNIGKRVSHFLLFLGLPMAKKGKEKNTRNKAKHTVLINRKKNKLRKEQESRKEKLKQIIKIANQSNPDKSNS